MSNVNKPRAVFGVEKQDIPGVLIRAMAMYDGLVANASAFSSPTITMVAFLALVQALSASQQATKESKSKAITTTRNTKRDAVWTAMQSLQAYVQGLADVLRAQAAAQLIALAGLHVAGIPAHAKAVLTAILTVTAGTVHLEANRKALLAGTAHPNRKLFFNWEMSSNGGQTWTALPTTPYASTDVTGLTALTTYSFRVSVTIGKVTQPWTRPSASWCTERSVARRRMDEGAPPSSGPRPERRRADRRAAALRVSSDRTDRPPTPARRRPDRPRDGALLRGNMARPSPSRRNAAAAKTFRRWSVPSVMRKLYRHATTALRLAPIDAEVAGRFEAVDLVDTMFMKGLDGLLPFDLPQGRDRGAGRPLPVREAPHDAIDVSSSSTAAPTTTTASTSSSTRPPTRSRGSRGSGWRRTAGGPSSTTPRRRPSSSSSPKTTRAPTSRRRWAGPSSASRWSATGSPAPSRRARPP